MSTLSNVTEGYAEVMVDGAPAGEVRRREEWGTRHVQHEATLPETVFTGFSGGTVPEPQRETVWQCRAPGDANWTGWHRTRRDAVNALLVANDLTRTAGRYRAAGDLTEAARGALHASIREAVAAGMSEHEAARVTGVSRMTVRKALGKR